MSIHRASLTSAASVFQMIRLFGPQVSPTELCQILVCDRYCGSALQRIIWIDAQTLCKKCSPSESSQRRCGCRGSEVEVKKDVYVHAHGEDVDVDADANRDQVELSMCM